MGPTVDGSEIRLTSWYSKYPIVRRISSTNSIRESFGYQPKCQPPPQEIRLHEGIINHNPY